MALGHQAWFSINTGKTEVTDDDIDLFLNAVEERLKNAESVAHARLEAMRDWITSKESVSAKTYTFPYLDKVMAEENAELLHQKWSKEHLLLKKDPGAHYRHSYTVKLTPEDIERGEVTIKLDPARIAAVYGMVNHMAFFVLKKILRLGSAHKDIRQELKDIRNATDRYEEMLNEDEANK